MALRRFVRFSARMNAVPSLVASRTLTGMSTWATSRVIDGDLSVGGQPGQLGLRRG